MYPRTVVFCLLIAMWVAIALPYLDWNWWLGIASCLLVVCLVFRMRLVDHDHPPLRLYLKMPIYIVWLLGQIIKANIDVARRILSPELPIAPRFIDVDVKRPYELTQVLYANSITLTPGTVSTDLTNDVVRVHALSDASARSLESGAIERKIAWLEK